MAADGIVSIVGQMAVWHTDLTNENMTHAGMIE